MSFNLFSSLELDLDNARSFIKELQLLEYFVRNVPLDTSSAFKKTVLNEVAKQMQISFSIHNAKVLKLWMEFINRANNEYLGITPVHLALLSILTKQHQYKLALQIVQHSGLPIYISISKYQQYLIWCSEIYQQFERHFQALQMLNMANSMESENFQISFMGLKLQILTHKLLGIHYDKADFQKDVNKIKVVCHKELSEIQRQNQKKLLQFNFEYSIFMSICEGRQLSHEELEYLKSRELLDLYQKAADIKIVSLKYYIKNEIAHPTLYRVKQDQIKGISLHKFETVRDINKIRPLYRSDSKNKILYFIHQHFNQAKLDSMINKACTMQRIIKNRPVESISNEREDDENHFGKMGGMGSFGGMMSSIMGFRGR